MLRNTRTDTKPCGPTDIPRRNWWLRRSNVTERHGPFTALGFWRRNEALNVPQLCILNTDGRTLRIEQHPGFSPDESLCLTTQQGISDSTGQSRTTMWTCFLRPYW
ncbi:hypothetical protein D8B26_003418 [Coccidioides posadasii str. Silveira]|uniref:uncharacterized protein n=1 Tax=Coccidioides posadasii (strain RMSCC 757 / Silveira) TaxID=443226 RepID=UPI001BEF9D7B|nr:hypothetical protein D8B26_003418 [Coccidioides posadasii str. Silveira]